MNCSSFMLVRQIREFKNSLKLRFCSIFVVSGASDRIDADKSPAMSRIMVAYLLLFTVYIGFMTYVDPYALISNDIEGKIMPNNHLYQYNYLKHADVIEFGTVGSSAVNYFPLESIFDKNSSSFSMGIESSNVYEHVAYGRLLADHSVKEIIFFVTFYALNPSRPNRAYFNPGVILINNRFVDLFYQYFNKKAFISSLNYLKRKRNNTLLPVYFKPNGERDPVYYYDNPDYNFDKTIAGYLAWESIDPRYYNSTSFRNPHSISKGINAIRRFKEDMEASGIKVRIAYAPVHRLTLTLILRMGLWDTFQASRRALASLGDFSDLNMALDINNDDASFWDSHHARQGEKFGEMLRNNMFELTPDMVDDTEQLIKPDASLIARLDQMFREYDDWENRKKTLQEELKILPPIVP